MSWIKNCLNLRACSDRWQSSASRKIVARLAMRAPDSTDPRHGGQIVAKILKSNDVKSVFVLSGGHGKQA